LANNFSLDADGTNPAECKRDFFREARVNIRADAAWVFAGHGFVARRLAMGGAEE
jgi:hypothetical protein